MKGRFAPSPTGRMHLGNIFCAMLSWLSAKSQGGEWLLRIEDIDPQRSKREYADMIMDDLQWLGLEWDGEVTWQSQRNAIYEQCLARLQALGMVYPCYCTRADILATQAPHESDGRVVYKGTCRPKGDAVVAGNNLYGASGATGTTGGAALRLMVPEETIPFTDGHYGPMDVNLATQVGDFIVRRKDGAWAYQLAVVADDALTGVTEVVRGRDLLLSSPQQIYLARLLGFTPPAFTHLPLLCNASGQRLSKRDQSLNMAALRARYTAPQLLGILAWLARLIPSPTPITPKDLLPLFDWKKIPKDDIVASL